MAFRQLHHSTSILLLDHFNSGCVRSMQNMLTYHSRRVAQFSIRGFNRCALFSTTPIQQASGDSGEAKAQELEGKITEEINADSKSLGAQDESGQVPVKHKKTMAELDRELMAKMKGLSGDGGEAGVEYENGQPVAMKRSVKNNMFRYI